MVQLREAPVLWALRILAALFVALAVAGVVRNFSMVPWWDMWEGYVDFYLSVAGGDWHRWWSPHNEHRIVLSRLLFWIDIDWFGGTQVFLIAMNLVLVGAAFLTLRAMLRERLGPDAPPGHLQAFSLFMLACLFSWMQKENLTWAFQSQFFLAQWLPLLALYLLYRATLPGPQAGRDFVLACITGALCIVTLASGVIALPLMTAYAVVLRMPARRIAWLAGVTVLCIVAYYAGYQSPRGHGSVGDIGRYQPVMLARYVLLYIGSPLYHVIHDPQLPATRGHLQAAQAFGALFVGLALLQAWRALRAPRQHALALCLLVFILYIGGTALGTGLGRLLFGLEQATSSRYSTPALMAWMALFVLYAPALSRQLQPWRHRVVWPLLLVLLVLLPVQNRARKSAEPALFEREIAAVALELRVFDRGQLVHIYPAPERGIHVAHQAADLDLGVFRQPWLHDAGRRIGQPVAALPGAACRAGGIELKEVAGERGHKRLEGWIAPPEGRSERLHGLEVVAADGRLVGYAAAGPRDRGPNPERDNLAGSQVFKGYVRADSAHGPLTLAARDVACAARLPAIPASPFTVISDGEGKDRINVRPSAVVANAGWIGSDYFRTRVPGFQVIGSYGNLRGDADTGALTLRLQRGATLFFRTSPTARAQRFAVDDGQAFQGRLPGQPDWVALVFDNPWLPEQFTLTLTDAGQGPGEWSAIGILDRP
jgi:hypothetical protein